MYSGLEDTVLGLDIGLRRNIGPGLEKDLAVGYNRSSADWAGSTPAGPEGSGRPVDSSLAGSDRIRNNFHFFRTLPEAAEVVRMSLRRREAGRLCWCSWEP